MCVGTDDIKKAPNLRAQYKNTSGKNGIIFVVANDTATLDYVLQKYNFNTITHEIDVTDKLSIQGINEDYETNKEDVSCAWIQWKVPGVRGNKKEP